MNILIIGGGPGGYVAAITAAKNGAQVTLVEKDELGGTCLNRGCIPAKTILHTANLFRKIKTAAQLGIEIHDMSLDFKKLMQRKCAVVSQLRKGVEFLLANNKVDVIRGKARLVSQNEAEVDTQEGVRRIAADNIIIATGSKPSEIPAVHVNGRTIINSDQAFELSGLPESMIIAGGGVIGCEFAQAFARLGCRVTVVEMLPRLIAEMDSDMSSVLEKALKADGVDVLLNCRIEKAEDSGNAVGVTLLTGKRIVCAKLMVAVGRNAVSRELGAEAAGVCIDAGGCIPVDGHMRTNIAGIYAVGDVTGEVQLAHVASHQGRVAVANIFGEDVEMDYSSVPFCIYTSPELASMGLSEREARENGVDIKTGAFPVSGNGRSLIEGAREGFAKTVVRLEDNKVLGIHLAGPNATEMISGMAPVFKYGLNDRDISDWIFAHPTVSEMIYESALDISKQAIHKA